MMSLKPIPTSGALKEWRHKAGITQQALQLSAGVSIATIVLIERYGYCPREEVRARIAAAIGVPAGEIWTELEEST
jgi:DNA-binding XRE family transcriptional regulator